MPRSRACLSPSPVSFVHTSGRELREWENTADMLARYDRVMPEVPQNMQQDLQRMEIQARSADSRSSSAQTSPTYATHRHGREPSLSTVLNTRVGGYGQQYQQQPQQPPAEEAYSPASGYSQSEYSPVSRKATMDARELPSFSHFPRVSGEHIPPSDDEKESVLAESRKHVLHSNDPDMQICWARDVLAYVEIAAEAADRERDAFRKPGDRDMGRPVTPKIEHELRVDALNIVNYLAGQGHPEAVFIQGKWYEFGKFGYRQDKKQAYSDYALAAEQGWARAEYRIGMLFENANDSVKAMAHYNAGLQGGDSAASYRLGMICLMGQHGQPRDLKRGLALIQSAADKADEDAPQGAFVYGMIVARDLPDVSIPESMLPSDLSVARQYIEMAAYLGFAKAQLKMGQAYELCQLGCEFNPALSLHYYGLAARQGQPEASLGVSRWFLFGYENMFAKNEQLAYKYALLAAKAKLATGEFAMGYYHEIGIHVEKDLREARRWYELAAEHGNKDALGRIDGLSHAQTLSKQDHETTTLTRIKSQHGSQRGQRPDRFKTPKSMPTVTEGTSPRVSPHPSPRVAPYDDGMPEPGPVRANTGLGDSRPPAFGVNLAARPKSAAPYPEDDRPSPYGPPRSSSVAPYPEDDMGSKPQLSPHYNPNIRTSLDRPNPGYGRAQPGPGMRPSQSAGGLPLPAGADPNRRPGSAGWGGPQGPADYGQPRPGSQGRDPRGSYDPRLQGGPAPNPAYNRVPQANATPTPPPGQYGAGGGYGPPGAAYGRGAPRPNAGSQDPYGGRGSGAPPRMGSQDPYGRGSGGPGMNSPVMSGGLPAGGPRMSGGRPGVALQDPAMEGRASAPPSQDRPGLPSPTASTSTANSAATAPAARPKPSNGPATFEEMGIPQAKDNADCVSLPPLYHPLAAANIIQQLVM